MNLGENIYRLRTARKLSQDALAEALDVSRQSVSKWENNLAVPDLDKLIKMRDLFGITLDELVAEDPPEPGEEPPSEPVPEAKPSPFQQHRQFLITWGVYLAAAYLLYRLFIRYGLAIPLVAMQIAISVYSLCYFRNTPYPFTKWSCSILVLCCCITYFFGIRLFTLEGSFPVELLTGVLYEQLYLVMLTFHLSVTVLVKALISWLKNR